MVARAVDSALLTRRADANRRFGDADFEGWVRSLLAPLSFTSVLDICCGTGHQLVLTAARPEVLRLVGVDISAPALETARRRLAEADRAERAVLECVPMDEAFACPSISDARFDLVSCFYGLYYAQDPESVLERMIERLSPSGTVMIVGPYGRNNAALFALLERHFELPRPVVASSTSFMEETVLPILDRCLSLEIERFVNPVRYPSAEALLAYWRASTFFNPERDGAVAREVEAHFEHADEFVVEKHVMAAIGKRAVS